jgi:hypothetical protein
MVLHGSKGNLVFFSASDGTDGGMSFAIFDAKTRKRIFSDSFSYVSMWKEKFEDSLLTICELSAPVMDRSFLDIYE